jgi:hypothetical protein
MGTEEGEKNVSAAASVCVNIATTSDQKKARSMHDNLLRHRE